MSTSMIQPTAPSQQFPLHFEITGGPTFQRIVLASMVYYDPDADMPLTFTGRLTDILKKRTRKAELKAYPYGFSSGTAFERGEMTVELSFTNYFVRFGSMIKYDFRNHKGLEVLELSKITPRKRA